MNEIYIDIGMSESRTLVVDSGELAEIHIERRGLEKVTGNIYRGKVENVLPGMQAAFIDIGLEKNAFLYIKDAVKHGALENSDIADRVSINNILKSGDELLVQVSKEPTDTKGARVTTHITLPGRYHVLMPDMEYIGISRRIEDEEERERLKKLAVKLKPKSMGVIIRTEAQGRNEEDFIEDINFQIKLWDRIHKEAGKGGAPRLVHKDLDLVYRSIRDLLNRDTVKVVINEESAYKEALELMEMLAPDQKSILEHYDSEANMLEHYGIEGKIEKALARKVWLKSGGYIVIDQTEALTSIDVNTGKFTGTYNLKETILQTNVEAAKEIARQLRLRDIGGIIIIDFIDMNIEEHRAMVLEILKNELKKDRTKSNVFSITQLGLVEMTRKKMGKRLSSIMQKQCPLCNGTGRILDEQSIAAAVERKLERVLKETDVPAVLIEVNDAVMHHLKHSSFAQISYLEKYYNKKIVLKGLANMDYSDFKIRYLTSQEGTKQGVRPIEKRDRVELNTIKSKYLNSSDRDNLLDGRVSEIVYDENGNIDKVVVDIQKK